MTSDIIKQNYELKKENAILKQEIKKLSNALSYANNRIKQLEENQEEKIKKLVDKKVDEIVNKIYKKFENKIRDLEEENTALKAKVKSLEAKLNIDSTNSGIPTSKERIGKHIIQNNREKSDKSKGSQKNHEQHKLDYFKDDEITEIKEHTLCVCPKCGSKELKEKNIVVSDIIDITISVTKTRNNIHNYYCSCCHKNVSANEELPRGVSYGSTINSIALSMMNESNTSLNKITSFFKGISNGEVNLCEGYLIKLQKRSAKNLSNFHQSLKNKILSQSRLFWDDTVCKFGKEEPEEGFDEKDKEYIKTTTSKDNIRNGIIRFYGNDNWALLIGHRNKDSDSIDNDGILEFLPKSCVLMHDHLLINYNDKYQFENAECNEHTSRYLKKNLETFPEHKWAKEMRDLLINTNNKKKELINNNELSFDNDYLNELSIKYDEIIEKGIKENNQVNLIYIDNKNSEMNLIERLKKFKKNHLLFAYDFSVEFTNNTAEKGLRQVKRKLAVSFMFKNANRMKDYAIILSYLETCYRNGISRFDASKRLCEGNPYSVEEIQNIIESIDIEKK